MVDELVDPRCRVGEKQSLKQIYLLYTQIC